MADIDRIIKELLSDRRFSESAAFSSRTFSDQPLIERGSSLRERMKQREEERAKKRQREAEARSEARKTQRKSARQQTSQTSRPQNNPSDNSFIRAGLQRIDELAEKIRQGRQEARTYWDSIDSWIDQDHHDRQQMSFSSYDPFDIEEQVFDEPVSRTYGAHSPHESPATSNAPRMPWQRFTPRFEPLPETLRDLRALEGNGVPSTLAYGSSTAAQLFYRQACLAEHYEDDYEFHGYFSQYYPTYSAMTDQQLRGYFSWRTRVRAGQVDDAPISFAFVYVYELLMGIGTTPGEQGLHDLRTFSSDYREASSHEGTRLDSYVQRWARDYAIYHDLPLAGTLTANEVASSVMTLLAAEHAQLAAADLGPKIPNSSVSPDVPSPDAVFRALGAAASYHICESRLAKDEPGLLAQVTSDVFAALVTHCAKRRKTDFVEGLFGYATANPYTMFSAAVFYDPVPHPDATVRVSPIETFTCTNGRWRQQLACEATERSSELGLIMHAVDYELREQLDYAYPLKPRKKPKYVERMVQKAVAARLKERADAAEAQRLAQEEAERRRITIDRSKLRGIRAAAALTQEALLTDEERGLDEVAPMVGLVVEEPVVPPVAIPSSEPAPVAKPPVTELAQEEPPASGSPVDEPDACAALQDWGLSPLELRVLRGLLTETPASQLLGPTDPFVSVVADTINEKLFDLVGDAIIEFDGDEPQLVEDYLEDVQEIL